MNNEGENPLDSATEMKIKLESNELEESLVVENGLCYSTDEEQNLSTKKLWTVEEASNLIKAYREHPNLWDSKHVDHKNVIKKYDSLKVLSKKFGTNCNEIKRKIKNIKSQYQRERRTYEQLKKSGAGHQFKARWFGYAAMSFLHDNNAARKNNQVCFDFETFDPNWSYFSSPLKLCATTSENSEESDEEFVAKIRAENVYEISFEDNLEESEDNIHNPFEDEMLIPEIHLENENTSENSSTTYSMKFGNSNSFLKETEDDRKEEKPGSTSEDDVTQREKKKYVYCKTENDEGKNVYVCSICDFKSVHRRSINSHMLSHSDKKLFSCTACSYACNFKGDLKKHLTTHSNIKLYRCTECQYECNRKDGLKIHLLKHANTKLFNCPSCGYKCNRKGDLKRHVLTHSESKIFICTECSFETNWRDAFQNHLLKHLNIKLYKCCQCTYETNKKCNLHAHMLTHCTTKLFKCALCDYQCNRKNNLKNHMLIHADKTFKCNFCNYQSYQKVSLKMHLLNHSNTKLFQCNKCTYKCNYRGDLNKHLSTHSLVKMFRCEMCSFECNFKVSLKKHLLTHSVT